MKLNTSYIHQLDFLVVFSVSHLLFLHAGRGRRAVRDPAVMLQCHNEDLHSLLHQLLPVVGEEQVIVRDAVAHRIIGAHHIQQRGEQRQSMSTDKVKKTVLERKNFRSKSLAVITCKKKSCKF